jgi:hypothetical protein
MTVMLHKKCGNVFEAMQELYLQNCGQPFVGNEIPPPKIRTLQRMLGGDACELIAEAHVAAAVEQKLGNFRDIAGADSNFGDVAKILVELCGPVCLFGPAHGVLCLAGDRILNLAVIRFALPGEGGFYFMDDLLPPWEHLWNEYKAGGLVDGDFPKTEDKRYPSPDALLNSVEMRALRRCIPILVYQSKAPIIFQNPDGKASFGIALYNGLRHVIPGVYLPPDPEILARAIATRFRNMPPRPYGTIEEAQAFFGEELRDLPEVDTAAIHVIAEGFWANAEWTQTPQAIAAYLQGYFGGRFLAETP